MPLTARVEWVEGRPRHGNLGSTSTWHASAPLWVSVGKARGLIARVSPNKEAPTP